MASYSTTFPSDEDPISEGGAWTIPTANTNVKTVSGGVRVGAPTGFPGARYVGQSFGSDQYCQATLGTVFGCYYDVLTRMQSNADPDCYELEFDNYSAGNVTFIRADFDGVGWTYNQLGSAVATTFASGQVMRLESVGSNHEGFKDGVSLGSRTDATYTGGQPGMGMYHDLAQDVFVDWAGGDLSSFSPSDPLGMMGIFGL